MIRLSVLALVGLAALGCAPNTPPPSLMPAPPPPSPGAGKSMVFLYWHRAPVDIVPDALKNRANLLIDGKLVGNLTLGDYLAVEVEPGKHVVSRQASLGVGIYFPAREGESVEAVAGKSHFIEVKGSDHGGVNLFARAEEVGREAIRDLRPVAPAPAGSPSAGSG